MVKEALVLRDGTELSGLLFTSSVPLDHVLAAKGDFEDRNESQTADSQLNLVGGV